MKTDCNRRQLEFHPLGRREVLGRFNGGAISSDGGGLLLRECERLTGIIAGFAGCFTDHRDPESIEHPVEDLTAQRVYGLCLGYEDLNDHDRLRLDPLLAVLVGKDDPEGQKRQRARDRGKALAGKSTLNRLELTPATAGPGDRYKKITLDFERAERHFVEVFLRAHPAPPAEVILDFDSTDDPIHGRQEGRFFHGYYDGYCYLPLYVFAGEDLLVAKLRSSNIDASAGALEELQLLVEQIRARWPQVKIIVRADSGFCRDALLSWCEENGIQYIVGLAKNSRLEGMLEPTLQEARKRQEETQKPVRLFTEFTYRTLDSWSRERRVVGKAEVLAQGPNPRFIVTNLPGAPQALYEGVYCQRGEMENRIKEQQLCLFADRTSCETMRANQIRLWMSSLAYLLMQALRRLGLQGTDLAKAQCTTIRLKLLKIGAQVRLTVRKVWVAWAESYPLAEVFRQVYEQLCALPVMRC